jgi:hypothetical protein
MRRTIQEVTQLPVQPSKGALTALVLVLAVFVVCSTAQLSLAQTTMTSTVTDATTNYNSIATTTTMTAQTTQYTTTNQTSYPTIQTTQTSTQLIATTLTATSLTSTSSILTLTTTLTTVNTSTQTMQLLGTMWGISLTGLLVAAALAAFTFPWILATHGKARKVILCKACGHPNPPFVKSFCVNCGQSLEND